MSREMITYLMRFSALLTFFCASSALAVTPMVAAGYGDSLALKSDGTVVAWGSNPQGQLGSGDTHYRLSPEAIPEFTGVAVVAAGRDHSLALKSDGTVWAWGDNYPNGQLGDGTLKPQLKPIAVSELKDIAAIAAGGWHSLALKSDGSLLVWGKNTFGQLGDGSKVARPKPVVVTGLSAVHAVAAGDGHSIALKADGTVWAWGDNTHGQLGDGSGVNRLSPVQISGLKDITAIAAAGNQSIALKADGTVWAWGERVLPGKGRIWDSPIPLQVHGLNGIIRIAAGGDFALALKADHSLWAWGEGAHGQLGIGQPGGGKRTGTPVQVPGFAKQVVDIAAGGGHGLALMADGALYSWGWNYSGQLGNGGWNSSDPGPVALVPDFNAGASQVNADQKLSFGDLLPLDVGGLVSVPVSASSGFAANLVSLTPDTCLIEGMKLRGVTKGECIVAANQPGDGHYRAAKRITQSIPVGKGSQAITFGASPLVIVGSKGQLLAVSSSALPLVFNSKTPSICRVSGNIVNGVGEGICTVAASQPGNADYNPATPVQQSSRINETVLIMPRMLAGGSYSLCLKYDGTVTAWGDNTQGQLGIGGTGSEESQSKVSSLENVLSISAGMYHTVALMFGGTVQTWGDNDKGQLGSADNKQRSSPATVAGLADVRDIAAGGWHSLALGNDGKVRAWGMNNNGQLGDGSTLDRSTPVPVVGLSDVKMIAAGRDFSLAVKSDGTLWTWGNNAHGQLGDGTTINRNEPVKVAELKGVLAVVAGGVFALAATNDGKTWAWGINKSGQLGNGSLDESHKPQLVPGVEKALGLTAGGEHALALLEGGALLAWGDNTYGQLGDGTVKTSLVPIPVAKIADVIAVAAGESHSVALKADGVKMSWGNNGAGQLGRDSNETIASYALPAEVPEPMDWKIWFWLWDQIKALPDKVEGIKKLIAEPPIPPLPPLPPIPEAPKLKAPKLEMPKLEAPKK